jgi:Icc-related predicted phosphoesterase
MLKCVAISDTHSLHAKVTIPGGDVLIHAGDLSGHLAHEEEHLIKLNAWLGTLPHRHKLVVPGNHDRLFERNPSLAKAILSNATVLIDEEVTIDGIRFYGSPWTPTFCNWYFMQPRGKAIASKWAKIPEGIDVLVTHGPPMGILDTAMDFSCSAGEYVERHVGCEELDKRVLEIKPQVHVFGHIHLCSGEMHRGGTHFINAAICDEAYRPVNPARVFEIEKKRSE